jgi:hypothetical protein
VDREWVDSQFALHCIQVAERLSWHSDLSFVLLLSYYLSRSHPAEVHSFLGTLTSAETTEYSDFLGLFALRSIDVGIPVSLVSFEKFCEVSVIHSRAMVRSRRYVSRAIRNSREKTEELIAFTNEKVLAATFVNQLENRLRDSAALWQRLWRSMTVYRAPWSATREIETIVGWICDSFFCRRLYPVKLRRPDTEPVASTEVSPLPKVPETVSDFRAEIVRLSGTTKCWFSIQETELRLRDTIGLCRGIAFSSLVRILHRTHFHEPSAIEIFVSDGVTPFINFPGHNSFEILSRLKAAVPQKVFIQTKPFPEPIRESEVMSDWVNGRLSNFDYLIHLNILSGRSFNDVTQYPIFPWVLSDYSSEELKLDQPERYRDLNKPMISINIQRLNELITRDLKSKEKSFRLTSYYLTPQEVARYVDHSAGFQSIAQEFEIASSSLTRYHELVPELYLMPELFSLGVYLPRWAHNSAVDFVYLLRKALESDIVSAKLHSWIDLIWGFKQQGSDADLTFNTFVPSLYDGAKTERDVLRVSGIVPHQLFQSPHPTRTKGVRKKDILTGIRVLEISDVPIIFANILYEAT